MSGTVGALLVIAQAFLLTDLVVAMVRGTDLRVPAVAVTVVLAARGMATWAGEVAAARAAARVGTDLRRRLLASALERGGPADAVLVTRGVSAAEPYLTRYLPAVVLAGVLPLLTVAVILTQDLLSALVVLATLPLVPLFGALVGLATRDRAQDQWRALDVLAGHFLDVVRGLPTLVAHRRARAQSAQIAAMTDRYRTASSATLRLAFASAAVLELVATLSVALVAVIAGVRLASGGLDLSTALVVLLLAPEAYWPLRRVGAEFHAAAEGVATFEQAVARLGEGRAATPTARGVGTAPVPLDAPLVLHDISVTYPDRSEATLSGINAVLPARGITVITGPSGCGKTTLLRAIAGLAPARGTLTRDGVPAAGPAWECQIAWLPQRPRFVVGTVADNLLLGSTEVEEAELWTALRRVALEERVRALHDGIDTRLGEDGATLSAGERARLALARAVLGVRAGRTWVLLDEPTAHVDDLTERVVADTLVELARDAAVVVVAHRPALVGLADHEIRIRPQSATRPRGVATAGSTCTSAGAGADRSGSTVERPSAPSSTAGPEGRRGPSPAGRSGWFATLLATAASTSGVALTATAGWLIVQASGHPPVLTMLVAIVGVRTFGLARPLLRYAERLTSHDRALRLLARRRVEVYDALVPLTPARLGRRRGDVLASVVDDVDAVVDEELRVRLPRRTALLVIATATVTTTLFEPRAGLVAGASAILACTTAWATARYVARRSERRLVALRAALGTRVVDSLEARDELWLWQGADRAVGRVVELSAEIGRAGSLSARGAGAAKALVFGITGAAMAGVALILGPAVAAGEISAAVSALVVLVPLALSEVILPVADAAVLSARTEAAAGRLRRLETTAPAVRDTVSRAVRPHDHALSLDAATVRWERGGALTAAITLRASAGSRIALVGPSGCGKSTAAALLMRFLDPVDGRATHGDVDLRDLGLDDVRAMTGLVDDDPHLFATTVVENVRLARPDASDADVEEAVRHARLGDWLDSLPAGLHTWIGAGHAEVSGGERARLAIARSLLAAHPVLVLDEPTAHLDHGTAVALAEELLTGERGRTVVWITHAEAGLDLVDDVVRLGGGQPALAGR